MNLSVRRASARCCLHTSMREHIYCISANDYDNSDYGIIRSFTVMFNIYSRVKTFLQS